MSQSSNNRVPSNSKTMSVPPLVRLLAAFLSRRDVITWSEWLPVVEIAAATPQEWVSAFCTLNAADQGALLDLLRPSEAGPLADALLTMLAARFDKVEDEHIRQLLLEEGASVYARNAEQCLHLQEQASVLSESVGEISDRLHQGLDAALHVQRLQEELFRLRADENVQDPQLQELYALETEVARLEVQKRISSRYDWEARQKHLRQLQLNVEEINYRKQSLETDISDATEEENALTKALGELAESYSEIQNEISGLHNEVRKVEQAYSKSQQQARALDDKLRGAQQDICKFKEERARIAEELKKVEQEHRQFDELRRNEYSRLKELHTGASSANAREIVQKIDEIFQLLPVDKADEGFASPKAQPRQQGTTQAGRGGQKPPSTRKP